MASKKFFFISLYTLWLKILDNAEAIISDIHDLVHCFIALIYVVLQMTVSKHWEMHDLSRWSF